MKFHLKYVWSVHNYLIFSAYTISGILLHPDGSKYDGDFVNNMMHGHGTYSWSDGSVYEGPFFNNR